MDSAYGTGPYRLDRFVFLDFVCAAESKEDSRASAVRSACGTKTGRSGSQCASGAVRRFGGMEEAKEQIREVVQGHLDPGKYQRYGLVRNGILSIRPARNRKNFLARATAGEFGLHFEYVSAPKLLNRWIGATGENIQGVFAQAAGRKPVLFFIDEIDSIGGGRQDAISDPGGAGREFNNITMALMSAIDQYRASAASC